MCGDFLRVLAFEHLNTFLNIQMFLKYVSDHLEILCFLLLQENYAICIVRLETYIVQLHILTFSESLLTFDLFKLILLKTKR